MGEKGLPPRSLFEVRMALVLFGGVSLAVYMNGIVQELLQLVRASQREDTKNDYWPLLEASGADVSIDVIAGTSAGGLNGLVLAKALATGSDEIMGMSELWKNEAQIEKLLDTEDPHALLSGEIMERNLLKIMHRMSERHDKALADKVPVLDLFVTATDLRGTVVTKRDHFGKEIPQMRNQHLFHLKKRTVVDRESGQNAKGKRKETRGYDQNDLLSSDRRMNSRRDEILAQIGRATSAFPGALPPQRFRRSECEAAGLRHLLPRDQRSEIWFSDGGILMNKPFAPVVKTMFERSARRPVERVLLWLNPKPPAEGLRAKSTEDEPHFLEIVTAPLKLNLNEDISTYLEEVDQQNRHREKLVHGFAEIERVLEADGKDAADASATPMGQGYRQMRAMQVVTELEDGFRYALRDVPAADQLVNALMSRLRYRLQPDAPSDEWTPAALEQLLGDWDFQYHARRLHYLLFRLDQYLAAAGADDQRHRQEAVFAAQPFLWNALEDWRNARWVLGNALEQQDDPDIQTAFTAFLQAGPTAVEPAERAIAALADYVGWVKDRAAEEEEKAHRVLCGDSEGAKGLDPGLGAHLQAVSADFTARDVMLFPLTRFGQLSEWDSIVMAEMGPGPTKRVPRQAKDKLASETLHHFGGFLDRRWRQNDILWGRLDAAELICNLIVDEAAKHLKTPELQANLREAADQCIALRHRQIMLEEIDIIDLPKLEARYQKLKGTIRSLLPVRPGDLPPAWQAIYAKLPADAQAEVRRAVEHEVQVAAVAEQRYRRDLKGIRLVEEAPMEVLWEYLTLDHSVGEEDVKNIRQGVLTNAVLKGMDNLIRVLNRRSTGLYGAVGVGLASVLRPVQWVTRLVLPWSGSIGRVAWMSGLVGVLFVLMHALNVITLHRWGWAVTSLFLGAGAVWLALNKYGRIVAGAVIAVVAAVTGGWGLTLAGLNMLAPFTGLPEAWQAPLFWSLVGVFMLASAMMGLFGRVPRTFEAPWRIVSLELAGTAEQAQKILASWRRIKAKAVSRAAFQVGADFVLILAYAPLLALLTGLGATVVGQLWRPLAVAGVLVAWGQLLAGVLDMVENIGLMQVLVRSNMRVWPRVAWICAVGKFILIGASVPFVVAWVIDLLLKWL